jgi:hypothetical protein
LSILFRFSLGSRTAEWRKERGKKGNLQLFWAFASPFLRNRALQTFSQPPTARGDALIIKLFFRIGPYSIPNLVLGSRQILGRKGERHVYYASSNRSNERLLKLAERWKCPLMRARSSICSDG